MTGDKSTMSVRDLRVQSGEVGLAVRSHGDIAKPCVVLVHGWPDSHTVWDLVVEQLASRYHVVTYDVRGAGGSDAPTRISDYKLGKLAEDLKAVTDAVCPDRKFHLVAHDWGSIQSWESVTAESMQSRIASYTTISGPCLDHVGHWMRRRLSRPTPRNLAQALGQLAGSWYIFVFHLPWLAPLTLKHLLPGLWPGFLRRVERVTAEPSATRAKDAYYAVNLYRANMLPRLFFPRERRTTLPVQIILPMQDIAVRPQLAEELHQWAPRLWRREVACGHWALLLKQPELLAGQVAEFVEFVETGQESTALKQARVDPAKQSSAPR